MAKEMNDGAVEFNSYCMPSAFGRSTVEQQRMSEYPSWNAGADKQARYPGVGLQGAKMSKQAMGEGSLK